MFNGSKGRLDVRNFSRQPWKVPHASEIRLTHNFKGSKVISADPLFRRAGLEAGILSSAVGTAGYTSIEKGRSVRIDEVVKL